MSFAGFAPLVRLTYTNSSSNIALYDYKRTMLELGLTREFQHEPVEPEFGPATFGAADFLNRRAASAFMRQTSIF